MSLSLDHSPNNFSNREILFLKVSMALPLAMSLQGFDTSHHRHKFSHVFFFFHICVVLRSPLSQHIKPI